MQVIAQLPSRVTGQISRTLNTIPYASPRVALPRRSLQLRTMASAGMDIDSALNEVFAYQYLTKLMPYHRQGNHRH